MKFLIDMPLSPALAEWLRSAGHEAAHASELRMNRWSDADILHAASQAGQIVVTADLDFPRLLSSLRSTGPGLILLRNGNYSEAESLDCLRRVLASVPSDDLPKSIVVVDREKIRLRGLPL